MAPRKKFTKQEIIDAAFEIAKEEGYDAITIREVAKRIGSSIAPIYVNFATVEELIEAVINKTFDVSKQLLAEQMKINPEQPFRNIGIASLRFAKEYNVLFRDLVMKNNAHMKYEKNDISMIVAEMRKDPNLTGFSDEELREILLKLQIFQTGLSIMVANGLLPENMNDEKIFNMLDDAARDVITSTRLRNEHH